VLAALQRRLGYQFNDLTLLTRALTHRSAARDHNERLEFLGDAVIGLIVASAFFDRFPEANEGALSRLRASVVSGVSLAEIARSLALSECLILGESERKSGGRNRDSILADTLEALAGAIVIDASVSDASDVVAGWLMAVIEAATLGCRCRCEDSASGMASGARGTVARVHCGVYFRTGSRPVFSGPVQAYGARNVDRGRRLCTP
jgi:ribonuclease-3